MDPMEAVWQEMVLAPNILFKLYIKRAGYSKCPIHYCAGLIKQFLLRLCSRLALFLVLTFLIIGCTENQIPEIADHDKDQSVSVDAGLVSEILTF